MMAPFCVEFIFFIVLSLISNTNALVSTLEYNSLQDLYNSTNGPLWSWRGDAPKWFASAPEPCSPEPWQGLTCTSYSSTECFVAAIELVDYNLTGSLPTSIGSFVNLTVLDLSVNSIHGPIPDTLGQLEMLTELTLSNNSFSGGIPSSLFDLNGLVSIILSDNLLQGPIDDAIGDLINLEVLFLDFNQFSSKLPLSLFGLMNLQYLDLSDNRMTGTIPYEIGDCMSLLQIDLTDNLLHGSIPSTIGNLQQLQRLRIDGSNLTGTIPESLYNCTNLTEISLSLMPLTGTISPAIIGLTNLTGLYLQFTNISGSIPIMPASIKVMSMYNMKLNGTIPSDLFMLPNLINALFSNNYLTGTIPSNFVSPNSFLGIGLNNNFLVGTIPSEIGLAEHLELLYLQENYLNGTIPNMFENLKLQNLQLYSNELSGSIPKDLYQMQSIKNVDLSYNNLNGSISEDIGNLTQLLTFISYYNELTGSLPNSIGQLKNLVSFEVSNSLITGHIPDTLCNCLELSDVYVQYNYMSGTIPECVFSTMSLTVFEANLNGLTGTIPSSFSNYHLADLTVSENELTGTVPSTTTENMEYFRIEYNAFHGSLPASLFNSGLYLVFEVDANYITGTIPPDVNTAHTMNYFNVYGNLLSGTVPYMGDLVSLQTFYVDQNFLSGSVACFNSSKQLFLENVDISKNLFTGTLPDELFKMKTIISVSSVQYCLTGSISETICSAPSLLVLALDGLHTSAPCRYNLLQGNYALQYHTPGSIPACLFSMPNIQTLHLSGNGIGGSLPYDLNVSHTLTDVALSYNQLTGSIPYQLQHNVFLNFDLSYNTFDGSLVASMGSNPVNGSIYLLVNRLSGEIPNQLLDVETISILDSNMFVCQLNRDQLPKHDSESFYYECGTSSLQHSMYVYIAFLTVLLMGLGGLLLARRNVWSGSSRIGSTIRTVILNGVEYVAVFTKTATLHNNIGQLKMFFDKLAVSIVCLSAVIALIFMPIYIILSSQFSIYENNYAWIVSSVYVSGFAPAMTLFVLYLLFTVLLFGVAYRWGSEFTLMSNKCGYTKTLIDGTSQVYKHYGGMLVIAVFNFAVVMVVNVSYVVVSTQLRSDVFAVVQVLLAAYKFVWNDIVVRNATKRMHIYLTRSLELSIAEERTWNARYLTFNAYTLLFNVIVIPCLATAVVSSECLHNVYVQPSDVVSTISYQGCSGYKSVVSGILSPNCSSYIEEYITTSFLPPYIYRYQCASTLVTTYAVVYVYKFILTAFIRPAFILYMIRREEQMAKGTLPHKIVSRFVPRLKFNGPLGKSIRTYLFAPDQFSLRIIMYLSVFVTFGVMFPPLAVMICVSVIVQCYFTQLLLGRFVSKQDVEDQPMMLAYLNQDATDAGVMFMKTVYVIGGPASFFYSYFVFDTYGDEVGGKAALWMAVPMFCFGIVCTLLFKLKIKSLYTPVKDRSTSEAIELSDRPSFGLKGLETMNPVVTSGEA